MKLGQQLDLSPAAGPYQLPAPADHRSGNSPPAIRPAHSHPPQMPRLSFFSGRKQPGGAHRLLSLIHRYMQGRIIFFPEFTGKALLLHKYFLPDFPRPGIDLKPPGNPILFSLFHRDPSFSGICTSSCGKGISIPSRSKASFTCSCMAKYSGQ